VHWFVGVHVLDVALGHLTERFGAVGSGTLGDGGGGAHLPGRAGLAGEAALRDDVQQPLGTGGFDAPAVEPFPGEREQAAEH
jgi:hypothetical protein